MWEQPLEDDQLRSLLLSAKRWARSRMTSACAAIDSRSSRPGTFKSRPIASVTASASCDARRRTNGAATPASAAKQSKCLATNCSNVPAPPNVIAQRGDSRQAEHTSDLQSLLSISYTAFCLQK